MINSPYTRNSNLELLRIVAMSMVVIWHFIVHTDLLLSPDAKFARYAAVTVIDGVDIFILISGYFLINVRWQTLIRLSIIVAAFYLLHVIAIYLFLPENAQGLLKCAMLFIAPFTGKDWWFIDVYFCLMALSPFFNKALQSLSIRDLRAAITILTFFEFYNAFLIGNSVSQNGYGIYNFIYLYALGYYLRREVSLDKFKSWHILLILLAVWILQWGIIAITGDFPNKYDNPTVVISAVCIFILFSRLRISSRAINYIAAAALGVYLIQDGKFGAFIYPMQNSIYLNHGIGAFLLSCFGLYLAYWLISILISNVLLRPLIKLFTSLIMGIIPNCLIFDFRPQKQK